MEVIHGGIIRDLKPLREGRSGDTSSRAAWQLQTVESYPQEWMKDASEPEDVALEREKTGGG